jgi:hypothetical protein
MLLLNVMILAFLGLQKEQIIICLELLNQEGIIGGAAAYKRYTLRTNIKSQVKDWLEVGANISYSNTGSSQFLKMIQLEVLCYPLIIDPLTPVFYNGALQEQ